MCSHTENKSLHKLDDNVAQLCEECHNVEEGSV